MQDDFQCVRVCAREHVASWVRGQERSAPTSRRSHGASRKNSKHLKPQAKNIERARRSSCVVIGSEGVLAHVASVCAPCVVHGPEVTFYANEMNIRDSTKNELARVDICPNPQTLNPKTTHKDDSRCEANLR